MLFDSAVLASWLVAGGTLALAAGTVFLALETRVSVKAALRQLAIEKDRLAAAQQPRVFPAPRVEWIDGSPPYAGPVTRQEVLPVTNGGPGVALNVCARLDFGPPGGVFVESVPTSLAPGDRADLRLNWGGVPQTDWHNVSGAIHYEDVVGALWRTRFRIWIDGRMMVRVDDTELMRQPD